MRGRWPKTGRAEPDLDPGGFHFFRHVAADVDVPTRDRVAAYLAVQNTYLTTFQLLGGFGLLLGLPHLGHDRVGGTLEALPRCVLHADMDESRDRGVVLRPRRLRHVRVRALGRRRRTRRPLDGRHRARDMRESTVRFGV